MTEGDADRQEPPRPCRGAGASCPWSVVRGPLSVVESNHPVDQGVGFGPSAFRISTHGAALGHSKSHRRHRRCQRHNDHHRRLGDRRMGIHRRTDWQAVLQSLSPGDVSILKSQPPYASTDPFSFGFRASRASRASQPYQATTCVGAFGMPCVTSASRCASWPSSTVETEQAGVPGQSLREKRALVSTGQRTKDKGPIAIGFGPRDGGKLGSVRVVAADWAWSAGSRQISFGSFSERSEPVLISSHGSVEVLGVRDRSPNNGQRTTGH